jgi:hypothetical protein
MFAPLLLSVAIAHVPLAGERSAVALAASGAATLAADTENPKVTALAREEFAAWQAGKIDRKRYTDAANSAFNDATVSAISGQLADLGEIDSVKYVSLAPQGGNAVYTYLVTCGKGKITMTLGLDAANKISAIGFKPAESSVNS